MSKSQKNLNVCLTFLKILKSKMVHRLSGWLADWLVASWLAELAPGGWAPMQPRADSN